MDTFKNTRQIYNIILRIDKQNASFLYFTLEANENIAFYSTLESSVSRNFRDIDIKCPIELKPNLLGILEHFQKEHSFEILQEQILKDNHSIVE